MLRHPSPPPCCRYRAGSPEPELQQDFGIRRSSNRSPLEQFHVTHEIISISLEILPPPHRPRVIYLLEFILHNNRPLQTNLKTNRNQTIIKLSSLKQKQQKVPSQLVEDHLRKNKKIYPLQPPNTGSKTPLLWPKMPNKSGTMIDSRVCVFSFVCVCVTHISMRAQKGCSLVVERERERGRERG